MTHWKHPIIKFHHVLDPPVQSWNSQTAPVGQGFWSLAPQLFSAWTWCLTKVLPPQLSYSWNTCLDTPLSHTVACNTQAQQLRGCFVTTPADRRRLILAFFCQIFHDACLRWLYLECAVQYGTGQQKTRCVFKYIFLFFVWLRFSR